MPSQQQISTTPESIRDLWETPPYIVDWVKRRYPIDIDLACTVNNAVCDRGLYREVDSLSLEWHIYGRIGFLNCPYSKPTPWLKKAWGESQKGFMTIALIGTPNGEDQYKNYVFGKASEIIFINGRIGYISPIDYVIKGKNGKPGKQIKKGDEVPGNTRGSCLIIYRPYHTGQTVISWVDRDQMKSEFKYPRTFTDIARLD